MLRPACTVLLTGLGFISLVSHAATTQQVEATQVTVCLHCNYQDARKIAEEHFKTLQPCRAHQTDNKKSSHNHACTDTTEHSVFKPTTEQMFGFRTEHLAADTTEPQLTDLNVEDATRQSVMETYELYAKLMSATRDIARRWGSSNMSGPHPGNMDRPLAEHVYPANSVFTSGDYTSQFQRHCASEPGHLATYMAFSATFRDYVETQINQEYTEFLHSSEMQRLLSNTDVVEFSRFRFIAEHNEKLIDLHVEQPEIPGGHLSYEFGQTDNFNATELGLSSIQYSVVAHPSAEHLQLEPHEHFSLISGTSLQNLKPENVTLRFPVMNDSCVVKALNAHFASMTLEYSGRVHSHKGFPAHEDSALKQLPPEAEGTFLTISNLPGYCRTMYFDQDYAAVVSILTPCS